ncbi:hypothetical protein BT96DRAFT_1061119 [Gymnopus androsaceus JB14]|uniref:Uncharacterized protein n=1 Tax=Gymnopus androsaceus JB14 TaxID=1447944 RepID=A0A6A4H0K8_9AGAR|nr:hypothetical protein BT96DRAFT_1061119 [Gymnopus androsaceus JB14]
MKLVIYLQLDSYCNYPAFKLQRTLAIQQLQFCELVFDIIPGNSLSISVSLNSSLPTNIIMQGITFHGSKEGKVVKSSLIREKLESDEFLVQVTHS